MILLITEQGATVTIDGGKVVVQTEEITKTLPKELIQGDPKKQSEGRAV